MTANDGTPMAPLDLLERIGSTRGALAALWDGLTNEQMICRPGPQGNWSVKDLVAQVTWWESFILERVQDLIGGEESQPAEHQDALNARAYEQHKDDPLADVLAAFDANWPRFEALITPLSV
ncbi:MAG TPA: DinB family protein [Aggregatilineales bacterium]|nr:DinB family protein [Aggregatilineales bacterium]